MRIDRLVETMAMSHTHTHTHTHTYPHGLADCVSAAWLHPLKWRIQMLNEQGLALFGKASLSSKCIRGEIVPQKRGAAAATQPLEALRMGGTKWTEKSAATGQRVRGRAQECHRGQQHGAVQGLETVHCARSPSLV